MKSGRFFLNASCHQRKTKLLLTIIIRILLVLVLDQQVKTRAKTSSDMVMFAIEIAPFTQQCDQITFCFQMSFFFFLTVIAVLNTTMNNLTPKLATSFTGSGGCIG